MNIEKIKEDLSVCYLKTIAAVNGIALENITHDEDSVDVIIKKVIQMSSSRRFNSQISVQLMINGKMYWLSLQSNKLTENKDSISIKIPKENILNNVTIEQLIEKAAKEGVL